MNAPRRNILSILDGAVRWTGIPARVARDISGAAHIERRHELLRWTPLLLIAFSCCLFVLCVMWPSVLLTSLGAVVVAWAPAIHMKGPLGRSALQDDEREAALRKDSYLFCFALLAFLNCVGQLLLLGVSVWQEWQPGHRVLVAASGVLLNLTLLGCLPTLYASWKLPRAAD